jgi:fucose permease
MFRDRRLVVGFLGFVLLGMPYAALGVAWPSVADDIGRSLGDLGFILVGTTVGYVTATLANGWLTHHYGTGLVLPLAGGIATASLAAFALAPSITVLVGAAVFLGTAGGALDAGMNAYVAVHGTTRVMGWLHALFGVGSTLGPLLTTELIDAGASWRVAFWTLAAVQAAVTVAFIPLRRTWPQHTARSEPAPRLPRHLWPVMAVALAAFALYTGAEVAAGEWSFSLFTEGRGIDLRAAGYLVTGYWAALTVGRIAMGIFGDRISHRTLLLGALVGATAGTLVLWWSPTPLVGALGLLATGFFLAPVFPVLVLVTSEILGAAYAPWAVGYQIAAAGVGAAVIPGLVGALVGAQGIDVAAPVIAVAALLLLAAGAGVLGAARRRPVRDIDTPASA